jgi:hypothetical protein
MKTHYIVSKCHQKLCPNCWEYWRTYATAIIKTRLWEKRCHKDKKGYIRNKRNKFKKVKHIIISPAPKIINKYTYWELRSQAEDFLYDISHMYLFKIEGQPSLKLKKYGFKWKKNGWTAHAKKYKKLSFELKEKIKESYRVINSVPSGVLIFHPYRLTREAMAQYNIYRNQQITKGQDPTRKWDWVRTQRNYHELIYYSPHFHFIGFTSWLMEPEAGSNWVYKTIEEENDNGKKVSILGEDDIYRAVNYLLSHTGALKNKGNMHSYVYTGNLSDSNGNSSAERKLKKNGFTVNDDEIFINETSKSEEKQMKNKCKFCQERGKEGKLFYIWTNLNTFFNAYDINLNQVYENNISFEELIEFTKKIDRPSFIKLHVIEALRLKMGKPPPIDYEKYIVTDYDKEKQLIKDNRH